MEEGRSLVYRKFVIGGAVALVILIYITRLLTLQVMSDDFKKNADSNAFMKKIQFPSRGLIRDRNGKILVYNEPSYNLMVVMNEQLGIDTLDFCNTIGITKEFYIKRMAEIKDRSKNVGYSRYKPQVFISQIPPKEFSVFQEKQFRFKGFYIDRRSTRRYSTGSAAHILGDVGEVSPKDIEKDDYYQQGDNIGKLGIERSYEKHLRGEKGIQIQLRDVHGRIKGSYANGKYDRTPIPGQNLTLGIDLELQLLAERLLQNKIGSIVAIEPTTGEVLCMASSPNYDPRSVVGRDRGKTFGMLGRDPHKPLLNRAIMGLYPPGSTFKTTQGLIFEQEGIVNTSTQFPCYRAFVYKGIKVGCHGHASPIALVPSLATSCNAYFCWGLVRMFGHPKYGGTQAAMTRWKDHLVAMGFGYPLGIDLPGERRGMIPNADYYDKAYKKRWSGLSVVSISIGQGEVTSTPLQIANLAATIANRGYFYTPHVVRSVENGVLDTIYTKKRHTMVDKRYYEHIVAGMRGAVLGGTCRRASIPGYEVCGKTGTAQNRGRDHSAFMGFAPMHKPRIAISVYIENGGFGAAMAVPLGQLVMEQYLNGKLSASSQAKATSYQHRAISYSNEHR